MSCVLPLQLNCFKLKVYSGPRNQLLAENLKNSYRLILFYVPLLFWVSHSMLHTWKVDVLLIFIPNWSMFSCSIGDSWASMKLPVSSCIHWVLWESSDFFNTVPAGLQGSSSVLYSVWSIQGNIPILADLTLFAFLSWILVTKKPPEMMLKEGATLKSFLHNWKWKSGMQGSPV